MSPYLTNDVFGVGACQITLVLSSQLELELENIRRNPWALLGKPALLQMAQVCSHLLNAPFQHQSDTF